MKGILKVSNNIMKLQKNTAETLELLPITELIAFQPKHKYLFNFVGNFFFLET